MIMKKKEENIKDDEEKEEENIENRKNKLLLISEERPMQLLSSRTIADYKCNKYDIQFIRDRSEMKINQICHKCNIKRISNEEKCPPLHQREKKLQAKKWEGGEPGANYL